MLDLTVLIIESFWAILGFIGFDYIVGISIVIVALAFLHRISKRSATL